MTQTLINITIRIDAEGEVAIDQAQVQRETDVPLVRRQIDDFLPRLGAKNRRMVRAFAVQADDFTFDDIAAELGESYHAIKMRRFNLGRTLNKVKEVTGEPLQLLESTGYDWNPVHNGMRNVYRVPKDVRDELRHRDL